MSDVKQQELDTFIHYCWKCKTVAPVVDSYVSHDMEWHTNCTGIICNWTSISKEQYAAMTEEEKQEVHQRIANHVDHNKAYNKMRLEQEQTSRPHCPMCKSTDFSKITTTSRMASIFAFGLASSSIGKQYKCNKCGHKW